MTLADGTMPALLLVEDDPVSAHFLSAALASLPARVVVAANCAQALAAADAFDLWLVDANLPDGEGGELLARLHAASPGTPAIAHTADPSPGLRERLLRAGFAEVLVKPLAAARLQDSVCEALGLRPVDASAGTGTPGPAAPAEADWDDEAALKVLGGQRGHVEQLRGLFLAELPAVRTACLDAFARRDADALRGALHKLRAGCGFVGAIALERAVAAWQDDPASPTLRDAFDAAAGRLLVQPAPPPL